MDFRGHSEDVKHGFGPLCRSDITHDRGKKRKRSRSPDCTQLDQGVKKQRWSFPSEPIQPWNLSVLKTPQPTAVSADVTPGGSVTPVVRVSKRKSDQQDVDDVDLQPKRAKRHHSVEREGDVTSSPTVLVISSGSEDQSGELDETEASTLKSDATSEWHAMEGRPYLKGPLLGQGGYGSVYAGIRVHDRLKVAIKYISEENAEKVTHDEYGVMPMEVALMQMVNSDASCPNILQLLDWFEEADHYVMILERPDPCRDLLSITEDRNSRLDENRVKKWMMQLIDALKHCESRGVLHRDVKPANILICSDTDDIKLLDFGCGDLLKDSAYSEFKGTYICAPPELFTCRQYHATPATVWSFGVTLYTIMCRDMPFYTNKDIMKKNPTMPLHFSLELEELIGWCLSKDPKDRPSLEDIESHPWFN